MRFEARELKPHAEPVLAAQLKIGKVYFAVQFIDAEMLVPQLEALVFVGAGLLPNDADSVYFQDVESHKQGIRFESMKDDEAVIYKQAANEIQHIFEYEQAIDVLLVCSLRRKEQSDAVD
jgi:hypothetical protein